METSVLAPLIFSSATNFSKVQVDGFTAVFALLVQQIDDATKDLRIFVESRHQMKSYLAAFPWALPGARHKIRAYELHARPALHFFDF